VAVSIEGGTERLLAGEYRDFRGTLFAYHEMLKYSYFIVHIIEILYNYHYQEFGDAAQRNKQNVILENVWYVTLKRCRLRFVPKGP